MSLASPYLVLQDFDQRCRANALGLPAGEVVESDWVGIGFSLNGNQMIAKMSDVTEILPPPETIRVPGVKNWVKGLANIRGTLLPILDMHAYLNGNFIPSGKNTRVLIINRNNIMAGLLVEEVYGMRRFKPESKIDSNPSKMGVLEPYLDGIFKDLQSDWSVFDIGKLVSHERFLRVV